MAFLDVSIDTLLDPTFTDRIVVTRRKDVVGNNGRTTPRTVFTKPAHAIVTMASSAELDRLPKDYQITGREISVVTKFPLQGEVLGKQPDMLTWRGDTYIIKAIDYYPQFGAGFVQAICVSLDLTDFNIEEVPSLVFSQMQNAPYLGVL